MPLVTRKKEADQTVRLAHNKKKQREYELEYARIEQEEQRRVALEPIVARDSRVMNDIFNGEESDQSLIDSEDIIAINALGHKDLSTYMPMLRGGGIEQVIAAMKSPGSPEFRAIFGGKFGPEAVKGEGVRRAIGYITEKGEDSAMHADLCVNWQIRPSLLLVLGFTKSSGLTTGEGWSDEAILALPRLAEGTDGLEATVERRRAVIRTIKAQKRMKSMAESKAEIAYHMVNKGMIRSIFLLCVFYSPFSGFSATAQAYRRKHYPDGVREVLSRRIPSKEDDETKHIELTNIHHFAESCTAVGIELG